MEAQVLSYAQIHFLRDWTGLIGAQSGAQCCIKNAVARAPELGTWYWI